MSTGWIYFVQVTHWSKRLAVINAIGRPSSLGDVTIGFTTSSLATRLEQDSRRSGAPIVRFLGAYRATLQQRNALLHRFGGGLRKGNGPGTRFPMTDELRDFIRKLPPVKPLPPILSKRPNRCKACGQKLPKGRVHR